MVKWILAGVLVMGAMSSARAELPDPSKVRFLMNQIAQGGQATQLGSWIVDHKVHVTKGQWSALKDGSLASFDNTVNTVVNVRGVDNKPAVIPANAIVTRVITDVINPLTKGDASATIALSLFNSTDTALQVFQPTSKSLVVTPQVFNQSLLGTKFTKKTNMSLTVSSAAGSFLTGGKFNVFVEYYLSDGQ